MADVSQSGDGYLCSCGFLTDSKSKFFVHIGQANRKIKTLIQKGETDPALITKHTSKGRANMTTGEITMPPYEDRTKEQKDESNFGRKELKVGKDGKLSPSRTTEILGQASEVRFVPRIYTTTYTPIMMQAQDAATKIWHWRPDMPFENFLDTCLFLFFFEKGIKLGSYEVDSRAYVKKDEAEPEVVPA